MGNSDCNTTVENNRLFNDMSKFNEMSKQLFFSQLRKDENSKTLKDIASIPQFQTKVRGQVITFTAPAGLKLPDVFLKVEKPNNHQEKEKIFSGLNNKTTEKPSSNEGLEVVGRKLKFGIDSILETNLDKPEEKLQKRQTPSPKKCLEITKEVEDKLVEAEISISRNGTSLKTDSDSNRSTEQSKSENKVATTQMLKIEEHNSDSSKNNQFLIKRNLHDIRYHPFTKTTFERSQSDPVRSPNEYRKLSIDRQRRKSESPQRSVYSFGPSMKRQSPYFYAGHEMSSKRSKDSEREGSSRPRSSQDINRARRSPFDGKTRFPSMSLLTSQQLDLLSNIGEQKLSTSHPFKRAEISKQHIENDEVFKDEEENKEKLLAAKQFAEIMKQRNVFVDGSYSPATSPEAAVLDKQKYKQFGLFPSFNSSLPAFTTPPSPNLNFANWQSSASNCHPAFQHLLNPYLYNQAALAYMRSLKTLPTQPMMLPNSFHLNKSSQKGSFAFAGVDSDLHSTNDKNGSSRKRRKWTRAVFSILQRRALEDSFKSQKYVAKPERRYLAERLGLTDAQVKIWFQNRRMKWRQEQKSKLSVGSDDLSPNSGEEAFRSVPSQACCSS